MAYNWNPHEIYGVQLKSLRETSEIPDQLDPPSGHKNDKKSQTDETPEAAGPAEPPQKQQKVGISWLLVGCWLVVGCLQKAQRPPEGANIRRNLAVRVQICIKFELFLFFAKARSLRGSDAHV